MGEPFSSLNDLAVHHVSYNEFEKQYVELSDWCEKSSKIIKEISSNILTCYLRQVREKKIINILRFCCFTLEIL